MVTDGSVAACLLSLLRVSVMRFCRVIGLAVAATALVPAAVARAEDGARVPPWAIRLEPGGFFTPDHLHAYGLVGMPPPAYLGVSLETRVREE